MSELSAEERHLLASPANADRLEQSLAATARGEYHVIAMEALEDQASQNLEGSAGPSAEG